MLILVRMIFIEESVQEAILLGLPFFKFKLRKRLRSLPSAPFNARCDGIGRICHGSPPLLDRTRADPVALLLSCSSNTSVKLHKYFTSQRVCHGSKHRPLAPCCLAERRVSYMFQSVAVVLCLAPENTIRSLGKASWRNLKDKVFSQDKLSCSTGLVIKSQALQSYDSRRWAGFGLSGLFG
jgi:hypothetical protein